MRSFFTRILFDGGYHLVDPGKPAEKPSELRQEAITG